MRGLLAAVLSFAVFFAAHAALYHTRVIRRKLWVMLWFWAAGGLLYAAIFRVLPADADYLPPLLAAPGDAVTWLNGAFAYWCLFVFYYQVFNMADNSVGVRCLIELSRASREGLTLEELREPYPFDTMVGRRLERLVDAGYLEHEGKLYRCTPKGRVAATLMRRLKGLLNLGPGG
jgi:hypothetical protein